MPTPPLPTRQQVDAAAPLEFAPAPTREQRTTIRIEVAPDGLHITAEYVGQLASIPAAIERLRAAGVLELVASSRAAGMAPAPAAQQRQAAQRVEPFYRPDGTACCPTHNKPLQDGQWGRYCSSKAAAGEPATPKGYCALRFTD